MRFFHFERIIMKIPARIIRQNKTIITIDANGFAYIRSDSGIWVYPIDTRFLSRIVFVVLVDMFPIALFNITKSFVSTGRLMAKDICVLLFTLVTGTRFT